MTVTCQDGQLLGRDFREMYDRVLVDAPCSAGTNMQVSVNCDEPTLCDVMIFFFLEYPM